MYKTLFKQYSFQNLQQYNSYDLHSREKKQTKEKEETKKKKDMKE